MSQDPGADRELEALQELGCKGRGLVEAEARFRVVRVVRIGVRLKLDPFEEPVGDTQVKMKVGVQGRAETMEEAHGPEGCGSWSCRTGLPQCCLEGAEEEQAMIVRTSAKSTFTSPLTLMRSLMPWVA